MAKVSKAVVDQMVRDFGEKRIDFEGMVAVKGNLWIGKTDAEVDGQVRFYEIKVTAKNVDFDQSSLDVILAERAEIENRKAAVKAAADKKKAKDKAKREEKAKAEEVAEVEEVE